MNIQDHVVEFLLSLFDAFMNVISLGRWSRTQGDAVPQIRVKE